MAGPPALPTQPAVGDPATASWADAVAQWVAFLSAPPLFKGYQSAGQAITSAALAAVLLDTNDVDTYSGHSVSVNTSRYVAQVAGWHDVVGRISYPANAIGRRILYVYVNGAEQVQVELPADTVAGSLSQVQIRDTVFLNVNDYVELYTYQNSGSSLTLSTVAGTQATMVCEWRHT